MRKRWHINKDACGVLALLWFFVWFILFMITMDPGDPDVQGDGSPQWWAGALWVGPYLLAGLSAAAYGFWRWLISHNGWLIRRVSEPVRKDLREHNG